MTDAFTCLMLNLLLLLETGKLEETKTSKRPGKSREFLSSTVSTLAPGRGLTSVIVGVT